MANITEHFIKDSDNLITLTLTEDGSAITGSWTQVDVYIGPVTISRTSEVGGITFSNGVLTIQPGNLTEDLTALTVGLHRVYIVVISGSNINGVYFGADDSTDSLYFQVSDPV